jgi:hypothetical protein
MDYKTRKDGNSNGVSRSSSTVSRRKQKPYDKRKRQSFNTRTTKPTFDQSARDIIAQIEQSIKSQDVKLPATPTSSPNTDTKELSPESDDPFLPDAPYNPCMVDADTYYPVSPNYQMNASSSNADQPTRIEIEVQQAREARYRDSLEATCRRLELTLLNWKRDYGLMEAERNHWFAEHNHVLRRLDSFKLQK